MSKNYIQTIAEINAGTLQDELTEALRTLVQEVRKTGGKGSLALVLDIKAAKGNQSVTVDAEVKLKVPTLERPTEFFFVGRDNSLLRDHPDQQKLELRAVEQPRGDIVKFDPATGEVLATA